ncbi:transcriptional regulator [Pseudogracilibacillus sp. SO30301A]|uniref:transcriptional regulator n=1 Tax=Pseudogracilibacillus sp. SO30301A TaxID=3098291 RepID=UPI00300DE5E3
MKSRFTISICVLFILFVTGCTNPEKEAEQEEKKDTSIGIEEKTNPSLPSISTEDTSSLEEVKGEIRHVHYAGDGKILISAEMLYLYDLETESILAEISQEPSENEQAWSIDNGYVVIQETEDDSISMTEWEPNYQGTFYNEELKQVFDFDFNQLLEEDDLLMSFKQISFNHDGTHMAYATDSGLYVYDFKLEKKTKVLDLVADNLEERSNIAALEQIGFINGGTKIAFKAQTLPSQLDQPSYDTCGMVNIDGTDLSNQTFDNYTCKELISYNDWVLLTEDVTNATGRLMVMDAKTEKITIHTLTEKEESGIVTGSDKGAYFATFHSSDKEFIIRIYDTKTGELIKKLQKPVDEKALLDRMPVLKVLDDTRKIIILLGSKQEDIETKIMIDQF